MRLCPWYSRSKARPWGAGHHPKEVTGNRCLGAALALATALDASLVPWAWEQPRDSLMWAIPELVSLLSRKPAYVLNFDWCQWGHPWKKSTTVKGRWAFLPSLSRRCSGGHAHVILQGSSRVSGRSIKTTELAAEYSRMWCQALARLIDRHARARRRGPPALDS